MVKFTRWEAVIAVLAGLFLAFTAGWFLGSGRSAQPLRVEVQRQLEPSERTVALPAPTPEPEREKININTATVDQLMTLPGIGEKRARDIVEDRERNGPFRFPEDVTRVWGIGEETLNQMIDDIKVEDEP